MKIILPYFTNNVNALYSRASAFTLQCWKTVKKPEEFLTTNEPSVRAHQGAEGRNKALLHASF
jgi:hypothetical protein